MKLKKAIRVLLLLCPAGILLLAFSIYLPFPQKRLSPEPVMSFRITDRNNILLREVLSGKEGRCRWVGLDDVSPHLVKATVVSEDRHFFQHRGVNPLAVFRALSQNVRSGRTVSGASTITQQLVRNLYHHPRTLPAKAFEAWMALRLENSVSKAEILAQYLNRIPYGNQCYGVEAASHLYFDKPAGHLSPAESAFLAALPRSPSLLNPYRYPERTRKRQREILKTMSRQGMLTGEEYERALAEPLRLVPAGEKFRAPHFCDYILSRIAPEEKRSLSLLRTTLDIVLQENAETLLRSHLGVLERKGITNGAVLVLSNETGEVLAMVGSRNFFDERNSGQVNGALSLRQPGSTLKPFTYALALERGMTAASLIQDGVVHFPTNTGNYAPRNYDDRYHGLVRLRSALASSYNIPAVSVLQSLGPEFLYRRLKELGFKSLEEDASYYGLGLTLGNGEVTLLELARAYSALARKGLFLNERTLMDFTERGRPSATLHEASPGGSRVFSPQVAYIITHILSDPDARIPSFGYLSPLSLPFPAAAKTGTSKDFRDNWTVGYTPRYTVAVWVGNFDGSPMHNVSGITGCGPLFRDVMLLLEKGHEDRPFPEPDGIVKRSVCSLSGRLSTDSCPGRIEEIFIRGSEPREPCSLSHDLKDAPPDPPAPGEVARKRKTFRVLFPQEGDIFKVDPVLRRAYQSVRLRVEIPENACVESVDWWVNDRKVGTCSRPFILNWNMHPGSYTIKATASEGESIIESRPVRINVIR